MVISLIQPKLISNVVAETVGNIGGDSVVGWNVLFDVR